MKDKTFQKIGWPWTEETSSNIYKDCVLYPKISIVTSSYNQADFIEETIRSVIFQNYPNLEYIIIDGGSTDNTIEIIKKYENQITYWVTEKDKGCADALNKGLELCTGDYFYYLNSDDLLAKDALHKAMCFIFNNQDFDVYYGHGISFYETLALKVKIYSSKWSLKRFVTGRSSIVQQSTFIKMEAMKSLNIRFNTQNTICWDGELLVDLSLANAKFKRMPFDFSLSTFRLHDNSITGGQLKLNVIKYEDRLIQINNKIYSRFPNLKRSSVVFDIINEMLFDTRLVYNRIISKVRLIIKKLQVKLVL